MALDIAQLKAAFKQKSEGGENSNENVGFWDKFFPFYKMDFDTVTTVRFLQDADTDNPLGFVTENKYHELTINGKKKKIACSKMYGEPCACCEESSKHYNNGDQALGKQFWRKIDYIAGAVPLDVPFEYPMKADENPARLVSMSKQLYEKLETEIVKGDLDAMPYELETGYDFRIIKNKKTVPDGKGGTKEYGNYADSGFARKSTPLADKYLANLELLDLKKFRFAKIEREQMEAMIESFLTGRTYDDAKEGGNKAAPIDTPKATQPAATVMAAVAATTESAPPAATTSSDAVRLTPKEILAKLQAKKNGGA